MQTLVTCLIVLILYLVSLYFSPRLELFYIKIFCLDNLTHILKSYFKS